MPEFAYIKYKIQRVIFKSAIFDLQYKLKKIASKYYKRFCLTYIQITRFQNLERLSTLELITLYNIYN